MFTKYKTFAIALILLPLLSFTQKSWVELKKDPKAKLSDISEAFEKEMGHLKELPHSGYKSFKRWEHWAAFRQNDKGQILRNADLNREAQKYWSNQSARSSSGNWIEIGPMQESNIYRGVGRVTSIAFHPTDPNFVLIGSPSAGVWKSLDNGKTWANNDESLANFGVSSIAFDPKNPDIIYIGTGDADADESYGAGVWKSTDGGLSYIASAQGMGDLTVGKLLVHPRNTNIIIAGTNEGIYKSEDAGASWRLTSVMREFRDLEFMPNHPDTLYASDYNYFGGSLIYKSVDTGSTWERRWVFEGVFPDQRYEIEVTKADPDVVYAISQNRVLKSTNRADSFKLVLDSTDVLLEPQGWYNASFEVSNTNPDVLFAGHVRLFRSQDGGKTWQRRNGSHADNHWLEINPHDGSLWVADDGGIHRSYDEGRTYEDLTNMGIGAIYGISQSPFKPMDVLQGYQDCGSKYYDGNKWYSVYGADGMLPLFDPSDETRFYTSWQYGGLVRHLNGIGSSQNVKMPEDEGPWVTSFVIDGNDSSIMYTAREEIWKSDSLWANKANKVTWSSISTGLAKNTGGSFVKIAIARTDNQKMYAIWRRSAASKLIYCPDIYASTTQWIDLSDNFPPLAFIADFETDPRDDSTIYMLHDRTVMLTTNHGLSWSYLNNNLPLVPVYSLAIDTTNSDLYLGTDIGVFYKAHNQSAWEVFDNGMSKNARVTDLEIYYHPSDHSKSRIKASTYGRGVWESDLHNADSTTFSFEPQTYITLLNREKHTLTDTFRISIQFRRHLQEVAVQGFDASDIQVSNGTVQSVSGTGSFYTALISADQFGELSIQVGDSIATALNDSLFNAVSEELRIWYADFPQSIGYTGPAGVGDSATIRAWFRSDEGFLGNDSLPIVNDLDTVRYWYDRSGHGLYAIQNTDSSKARYRVDSLGIAGHPALEFIPINRFMRADGLTKVGKNITVFEVATSNTQNWSSSGWIANARTPNGFVMHVNNNNNSMRSEVLSGRGRLQYLGAESNHAIDITKPNIYGIQWNQDERKHYSILNDKKRPDNVGDFEARNPEDTIYVRFGKDNWKRWGNGKIAEFLYYNVDLYETKRILVSNYLSCRYGVTLEAEGRYEHCASHKYDIIGIGQVAYYDFHNEAKGEGNIHLKDPDQFADGDFLMLGHDGDSAENWVSDNVPSGKVTYRRIKRTWAVSKSDQSGFKGSRDDNKYVSVLIDSSIIPSGDDELGIAFSNSTDFSNSDEAVALFLNSDGKYEARVNFKDAQFFTIVTAERIELAQDENLERIGSVQLVPNPGIDGRTSLRLNSEFSEDVEITILNAAGQQLGLKTSKLQKGRNTIDLNLAQETPGVYLIQLSAEHIQEVLRFVR